MKKQKKTGLGRGVASLIPDISETGDYSADTHFQCPIDDIKPNRFQPRTNFSKEELEELKDSILEQGVIQPLLVRSIDGSYELIAGERRLRAAQLANLTHIPVFVKDLTDEQALEVAIIENVQRQDLNALEEGEAYYRLTTEFNYNQEMISNRIGRSRSTIANLMRLRTLPEQIKDSLIENKITMGHARSILGAGNEDDQMEVWQLVLAKDLSVRQTERYVSTIKKQLSEVKLKKVPPRKVIAFDISKKLSKQLDTTVRVVRQGAKGVIEVRYTNRAEFERLMKLLFED